MAAGGLKVQGVLSQGFRPLIQDAGSGGGCSVMLVFNIYWGGNVSMKDLADSGTTMGY